MCEPLALSGAVGEDEACGEATPHDLLEQITVGAGVSCEIRCLQTVNEIALSGFRRNSVATLLAMTMSQGQLLIF
jgi:hypothetical protein